MASTMATADSADLFVVENSVGPKRFIYNSVELANAPQSWEVSGAHGVTKFETKFCVFLKKHLNTSNFELIPSKVPDQRTVLGKRRFFHIRIPTLNIVLYNAYWQFLKVPLSFYEHIQREDLVVESPVAHDVDQLARIAEESGLHTESNSGLQLHDHFVHQNTSHDALGTEELLAHVKFPPPPPPKSVFPPSSDLIQSHGATRNSSTSQPDYNGDFSSPSSDGADTFQHRLDPQSSDPNTSEFDPHFPQQQQQAPLKRERSTRLDFSAATEQDLFGFSPNDVFVGIEPYLVENAYLEAATSNPHNDYGRLSVFSRFVIQILLPLLLLATLVACNLSAVSLGAAATTSPQALVLLTMCLVVADSLTLLRCLKNWLMQKKNTETELMWSDYIFLIIRHVPSVIGITMMVLYVMPRGSAIQFFIITSGLSVIPGIIRVIPILCLRREAFSETSSTAAPWTRVLDIFALLLQLVCLIVLPVLNYVDPGRYPELTWELVVAMLLVSSAFWEFYFKGRPFHPVMREKRYGAGIFIGIIKIGATFGMVTLIIFLQQRKSGSFFNYSIEDFWNSFPTAFSFDALPHSRMWLTSFIVNTVGGLVSFYLSWVACGIGMQTVGFAFPISLATPISCIIALMWCSGEKASLLSNPSYFFQFFCLDETSRLAFGVLFWLSQQWICRHIYYKNDDALPREQDVFESSFYDSILPAVWLQMNRKRYPTRWHESTTHFARQSGTPMENIYTTSGSHQSDVDAPPQPIKRRVFVCGCLYREEEHEVKRLGESIVRLDRYQALRNRVDFEVHLVVDNAFNELGDPAPHVINMMLWLKSVGFLPIKQVARSYGAAMVFYIESDGLEFHRKHTRAFVHLKDTTPYCGAPRLKRYSQILYLKQIIKCAQVARASTLNSHQSDLLIQERRQRSFSQVRETPLGRLDKEKQPLLQNSATMINAEDGEEEQDDDDEQYDGDYVFEEETTKEYTGCFKVLLGLADQTQDNHIECQKRNMAQDDDPNSPFVLTLDGDIGFEPAAVAHLVDVLQSDPNVGGVCGRVHPTCLDPFSFLYWFQIFEYAIGHWLTKACEHVFGTVLCLPGCFSMFRLRALQGVLPEFSRKVKSSAEFLRLDMGEDRYMCTLLIKRGWILLYCAAADSMTYCPVDLKVFFMQRRRWIISTLANFFDLLGGSSELCAANDSMSMPFLVMQGITLFSSIISPAVTLAFISDGLSKTFDANVHLVLAILCVSVVVYVILQLQIRDADLKHSITLSYVIMYSLLMFVVIVGLLASIASDPMSASAVFFYFVAGSFILAAALHPFEYKAVLLGPIYLALMPMAYLILVCYSVVHVVDQSWGTRDGSGKGGTGRSTFWSRVCTAFSALFGCESSDMIKVDLCLCRCKACYSLREIETEAAQLLEDQDEEAPQETQIDVREQEAAQFLPLKIMLERLLVMRSYSIDSVESKVGMIETLLQQCSQWKRDKSIEKGNHLVKADDLREFKKRRLQITMEVLYCFSPQSKRRGLSKASTTSGLSASSHSFEYDTDMSLTMSPCRTPSTVQDAGNNNRVSAVYDVNIEAPEIHWRDLVNEEEIDKATLIAQLRDLRLGWMIGFVVLNLGWTLFFDGALRVSDSLKLAAGNSTANDFGDHILAANVISLLYLFIFATVFALQVIACIYFAIQKALQHISHTRLPLELNIFQPRTLHPLRNCMKKLSLVWFTGPFMQICFPRHTIKHRRALDVQKMVDDMREHFEYDYRQNYPEDFLRES